MSAAGPEGAVVEEGLHTNSRSPEKSVSIRGGRIANFRCLVSFSWFLFSKINDIVGGVEVRVENCPDRLGAQIDPNCNMCLVSQCN